MPRSVNTICATTPDNKVHGGHRARMRDKLLCFGDCIFDDHELLEMLLYHTIPMRDTNPIAHRLLAVFGTIEGVLSASREQLMGIDGVKEKTADLILSVSRFTEGSFLTTPIRKRLDSHSVIGKYFADRFATVMHKETHMMLLTNSMELISTQKMFDSDIEDAQDEIASMVTYALKKGAAVVILAHNHPYGPLYETPGDHYMTARLKESFSLAGILLIEHYIICGEGYCSTIGKIDTLSFYQTPEVAEFIREREAMPSAGVFMRP